MKRSPSIRLAGQLAAVLLGLLTLALPAAGAQADGAISADSAARARLFTLAAQFDEPLVRTAPTSTAEDRALLSAIEAYRTMPDDPAALNDFLSDHPRSGWRVPLLTNLGLAWYNGGYFSRAIAAWDQAWREGRGITDPCPRATVDRALGELMRMHARLGHADRLDALFRDIGDRQVTGPATEALAGAREGLWMMRHEPGIAYLCGPMALKNLALAQGAQPDRVAFLDAYRSGPRGVSLAQVAALADSAKLRYRMVFRDAGQPVPVPSIVHWKVSHFAAIVGEANGRFHLEDPTFGTDLWITRDAIDAEASGYFLAPSGEGSSGWRAVGPSEAEGVRGMGFTSLQQFGANLLSELLAHFKSCSHGMCDYNITMLTVGVHLEDTPVGYTPPRGPDAHVLIVYNQREDSQPGTFGWFNVSPKWTLNWLAYIQDNPNSAGASVMRYAGGGGSVAYTGYKATTGAFDPETRDASVLVRTFANPIVYERRMPDGAKEVYGQSNGAATNPRRVFLTQIVDPAGNTVSLAYDSQLRLTSLTDATGRATTFSYDLPASPLLVTKVTDPFGRSASLVYDASGNLSKITDVLGLTSSFAYNASGLVTDMTTPYGSTHFDFGNSGTTRFVNATDALGHTERIEFRHQAPGIAGSDKAPTVPKGLPRALSNAYLEYRNTFYWDKHAYALAAGDYTKSRMTHFHHWVTNSNETAHSVESVKLPLEDRVWSEYPGQAGATYSSGSYDMASAVARVLDDGTSQVSTLTYNALGNVTSATDPLGRITQFVYDANNIDLLEVKQKTSATAYSTIAQFTYNSQHRPVSYTDTAGEVTTYAYNGAGQITQAASPLNQITKYEYDGSGYLTRIVNPNSQTAASFKYDNFGRIAERVDSEGYTVDFFYDALDRPTKEGYPDGTTRTYTWTRLDLTSVKDRQGRITQYSYDAVRNLTGITDPLNRKTGFAYYENGVLKSLTDPKGDVTSWDIDLENRVTAKHYADGRQITNTYETATSRLKSVTDALGQIRQYSYAPDDQLVGITYANAVNETPDVSFTYDPYFRRLASMTDGSGTTQYAYQAVGSPGALRLSQEDGPYHNDTIGYQYDALGRVTARSVDASTETFTYDALGRTTSHASPLGTFDFSYLGQTGQLISRVLSGGSVRADWTYEGNTNDRRLKSIANSGAARSFQYTTTPENLISEIAETPGAGNPLPAKTWDYAYDSADRLLSASAGVSPQYGYTYDDADNITAQEGPDGSTSAAFNNLNQITRLDRRTFVYDANGNLMHDGEREYKWDAEDRLIGIADRPRPVRITPEGPQEAIIGRPRPGPATTFRYDGLGRRIAIVTNGVETRYLWCGQELCQARNATDLISRRYLPEGEVIAVSGTLLYYGQDQLGSVRDVLAVQNGSRVAAFDYDPYGNSTQTSGRVSTDFRYAGMFFDQKDGLYLTQYRAYAPKTGRWLSRDPTGEEGGINLYSYVNSNPTSLEDPSGLCSCQAPPLSTASNITYDPSDPSTHQYFVATPVGVLSAAKQKQLLDLWRNGPNAAPGIAPNTPDYTNVLLANVPGTPNTNWIYLQPVASGLGWINVTQPGHYFYSGTVTNTVQTWHGITYLSTVGTGNTSRWFQNDVLGDAFFQLSQFEAIAAFYGASRTRIGSTASCR
jgi:RHS repeat-associated protein